MTHKYTGQIGSFIIVTRDEGFIVRDTCRFNHWRDSQLWESREEAESYAVRATDFKQGRRFSL